MGNGELGMGRCLFWFDLVGRRGSMRGGAQALEELRGSLQSFLY